MATQSDHRHGTHERCKEASPVSDEIYGMSANDDARFTMGGAEIEPDCMAFHALSLVLDATLDARKSDQERCWALSVQLPDEEIHRSTGSSAWR
jgi:hypothetical protein